MSTARAKRSKPKGSSTLANRWRRHAFQMAHTAIDDYTAELRERVQTKADELRREALRNPHHPHVAVDLVTQLEHYVVQIAPPRPRIEGNYERL